jgi:hypothetical protein
VAGVFSAEGRQAAAAVDDSKRRLAELEGALRDSEVKVGRHGLKIGVMCVGRESGERVEKTGRVG